MSRLTAETLHGIWAAVTLSWDEHDRLDEGSYRANIRRTIAAGAHGLYTTGSTGEFYALDDDEFRRMVDIQVELCGPAGMPLQIGCASDATRKTIRMVEYAARHAAVGAVQVTLPYWMALTDREVLEFFRDVHSACPQIPLVHYNIDRSKHFLTGSDYVRILEVAPTLVGVKFTSAGSRFSLLQESLRRTPQLAYFVGENLLVSGMQLGARGSYSSLISTNPEFILRMYALAEAHRWDEAIVMQKRVARFFGELEALVENLGQGMIDPVADKGLAVAAGFCQGHQRCRRPYLGWSDQTVHAVRNWMQANYPEFIYREG